MKSPARLLWRFACTTFILLSAGSGWSNDSISFLERFALAEDRSEVIEELIPGTEDYYYYSALVAQQEGRLGDVAEFLEPWQKRHGESGRYREILNRQALLEYGEAPDKTLAYLKRQLGLGFNHQQQRLDRKPDLPIAIDPGNITWEAFYQEATRQGKNLNGIKDGGLDRIIREELNLTEGQRKDLLKRLKHPDYERLVGLIAAELRSKSTGGFGAYAIHQSLTLAQLDELAELRPQLAKDPAFVDIRLAKLRPNEDESPALSLEVKTAYIDRLWDYVKELDPVFNSMKANVLYQKLDLARHRGEYPRELFMEYIGLPRAMPYVEPRFLQRQDLRGFHANLHEDFSAKIGSGPVRSDEALVRAFLEHFFIEDESYNRFSSFLRESYLKQVFAETKLLNGVGNAERWFSMLTPGQVQNLKERIEISFSPVNARNFAIEDDVVLALDIKNVSELIVKVYEINSLNFYLDQAREINTDLNLDGLIANEEKTYRYEEAPIRRHGEAFAFDSLKNRRGVWVIEFIGNGISSRALVRKGKLQYLSESSPGGELVSVFNEQNALVKDASVWFGGKRYDADKEGRVLLPFSKSGEVDVVLSDGVTASFTGIKLPEESYRLELGALLDQEALLPGREAVLALRPVLSLNGVPVPASLLEKVRLTVTTIDQDGVDSKSEAVDFKLFDDRESLHRFRVPNRLKHIYVELVGEIPPVSHAGPPIKVDGYRSYSVNGVNSQNAVTDIFLSRINDSYVAEVLGKSGEALADRAVTFRLSHRDFQRAKSVGLKTDRNGRIALGRLEGIEKLTADSNGASTRVWALRGDSQSIGKVIHATKGNPVTIPAPGIEGQLERSDLALFEVRNGSIVRDVFEKAKYEGRALTVSDLEPGDYRAILRSDDKSVLLKITEGKSEGAGYALSGARHLQFHNEAPLHISDLTEDGDEIEIEVKNAGELARVHIVATRFLPQFDLLLEFGNGHRVSPVEVSRGSNESLFVSGRDIGEEYRYILERRGAKKFPGNLMSRPGLLLNPWELNDTDTEIKEAEEGDDYKPQEDMKRAKRGGAGMDPFADPGSGGGPDLSRSLNFLKNQGIFISNIAVGDDGKIVLSKAELGDRQHVHVFAADAHNTAYAQLSLKEGKGGTEFRDLRLRETLNLEKSFTQRRNVTLLEEGETLTIEDLRSAEMQTYDTIGQVYDALVAINPDQTLRDANMLMHWPSLDEETKRGQFSDLASHEIHFFLSQKDPEYFERVVKPYIANKKDKTFMDHYLLGDDLSRYLAPWQFSRLNIVERILMGRRLGEEEWRYTASHVSDLNDLLPPDPAGGAHIFRQALRGLSARPGGGSLNVGGGLADAVAGDAFGGGRSNRGAAADPFAAPAGGVAATSAMRRKAAPESLGFAGAVQAQKKSKDSSDGLASAMESAPASLAVSADLSNLREQARQQALFQKLESTKEWAENNYRDLPIESQNGDLVQVNAFWEDYAEWDGKGGFYSREFPVATGNFTEMMFVLSVLDLPFEAEKHEVTIEESTLKLTSASPVVIFHEEIQETGVSGEDTPILVSQNFFRADDRYRYENGQQLDKFVTSEFLTGVVYGGQVVVTNPTSSAHNLDLLVQIPAGGIPVGGSDYTRSYPLILHPFSTERHVVLFYFPENSGEGSFDVYPVQVARNEEIIASGSDAKFKVVDQLTEFDEASWEYLSQFGTEKEVLAYLANNNLHRLNLGLIAWRARENVDFFKQATKVISERHAFDQVLWSYGLYHNVTPQAREYLKHREGFLRQCGSWIDCELVSLDSVERHWYQHLEYSPMVNARAHRLGRERRILNDRFREQYNAFLKGASYRPELSSEEMLTVAGYLFLQDRIEDGLNWLKSVKPDEIEERLQYDYLTAYAAFFEEKPAVARRISNQYVDHPVDRWRFRFKAMADKLKDLDGELEEGEETRDEKIDRLSSKDPFFELTTEGRDAQMVFRNLGEVTVNFYEMDLEFLFSSQPFVSGGGGQFSYIRPNASLDLELPDEEGSVKIEMPEAFASKNVLVEVVGDGKAKSVAVYSNALKVQFSERYGRLAVLHDENGKPLSKAYVKVYARMKDGSVRFFKDGYTDFRGEFDYVSLNTNELDHVDELSLLVMSDEHGSLVREVSPPQR